MIDEFDVDTWPEDLRYRCYEREGIKMDSHTPQPRAALEARRETWAEWLEEEKRV